jgi:sigma-E factor negative regulatory protein RseA
MKPVPSSFDPAARERCSALMDGELSPEEGRRCLDRLAQDPAARVDWALWHCVSDALGSPEVLRLHQDRFIARVEAALAAEPTVLAPQPAQRGGWSLRRLVLPATATAAAAALLALVAVPLLTQEAPAPSIAAQAPPAPAPTAGMAATGPLQRSAQVEAYLAAHRELTGAPALPGSAPYLRAALETETGSR